MERYDRFWKEQMRNTPPILIINWLNSINTKNSLHSIAFLAGCNRRLSFLSRNILFVFDVNTWDLLSRSYHMYSKNKWNKKKNKSIQVLRLHPTCHFVGPFSFSYKQHRFYFLYLNCSSFFLLTHNVIMFLLFLSQKHTHWTGEINRSSIPLQNKRKITNKVTATINISSLNPLILWSKHYICVQWPWIIYWSASRVFVFFCENSLFPYVFFCLISNYDLYFKLSSFRLNFAFAFHLFPNTQCQWKMDLTMSSIEFYIWNKCAIIQDNFNSQISHQFRIQKINFVHFVWRQNEPTDFFFDISLRIPKGPCSV